jgi:integrase
VWWCRFWSAGKVVRESSESSKKADAVSLLKRRLTELGTGSYVSAASRGFAFEDVMELLKADYLKNERRTLKRAGQCIAHLAETLAGVQAADITQGFVDRHIAARLAASAARATVSMEVAMLSRAFVLAKRKGYIPARPRFEGLPVENTRTQGFTTKELSKVLDVLRNGRAANALEPAVKARPWLVPPILFASWTGWRLPSDVATLTWRQVDFDAGEVTRWSRGTSKAPRHVVFPFSVVPELKAMLFEQREATTALERATASVIPTVFHHRGKPIRDLYGAWRAACRVTGVPGRRPHDLRRMAARRLRTLGMDDRDISELIGWSSVQMVGRYLGRDPAGVRERFQARLAESGSESGTIPTRKESER